MAWGYDDGPFPPYVSAAERRRRAVRKLAELRREGRSPAPVVLGPRAPIAATFWGKAWCEHLASYADYATRLPRGRSYVRAGAVLDLRIATGEVRALVCGSDFYDATVAVRPLAPARWEAVRRACAGRIGSVVELLSGKLSQGVMEVLCDRDRGLFPREAEIELSCSCPDGARFCKHLAAALYGVGARLDEAPELLFTLRGVDGAELVAAAGDAGALVAAAPAEGALAPDDLAAIFGIELERGPAPLSDPAPARRPRVRRPRPAAPPPPPRKPRRRSRRR